VLKTIFWVKILKFSDADPGRKNLGSRMEKSRIRGKHPGSATLVSTWEIKNQKKKRQKGTLYGKYEGQCKLGKIKEVSNKITRRLAMKT
jgi:hypothetical protein